MLMKRTLRRRNEQPLEVVLVPVRRVREGHFEAGEILCGRRGKLTLRVKVLARMSSHLVVRDRGVGVETTKGIVIERQACPRASGN